MTEPEVQNEEASRAEDLAPAAEASSSEARIAELEKQLAEMKDRALREMADAENTRRRAQKDREETSKYAIANFAKEMLALSDNFTRALESAPTEKLDPAVKNFIVGIEATERQFLAALERFGIKKVNPLGQIFDPHFHRVMMEVDAPDQPPGTIVQVLQAGYMIQDRLWPPPPRLRGGNNRRRYIGVNIMGIFVVTTGGTIGALPFEDPSNPPKFSLNPPEGSDFVRDILKTTFASFGVRCHSLEPRDSKLIDEAYRQRLLTLIVNAPEKQVLITHGTDTILKTADFFYREFEINAGLKEKRIVLTGAMTPLTNGAESDGHLNLAYSLNLLSKQIPSQTKISIVLCDYNDVGDWAPRLYPHTLNKYVKFYDVDGRHHRLKELT